MLRKLMFPFREKVVVTLVDPLGKSSRLVIVRTGITPKNDMWLQVWRFQLGIEEPFWLKGILRMFLRPVGQAEPTKVGVLC